MRRLLAAVFGISLGVATLVSGSATAGDRVKLGYGRIVNNDLIGDGHDRWRSGSVTGSRVYGSAWNNSLPSEFGDLIELRLHGEVIQPSNLTAPAASDRRFAGTLSLGMHTHFDWAGNEMAVGADVVAIGSQTGMDDIQEAIHDLLGLDQRAASVAANQISNQIIPTMVVEGGRTMVVGSNARLRPFAEARVGAETLIRAGVDLTIGRVGQGELMVRDSVTGQRYRVLTVKDPGYSWVFGGDVAHVVDSAYLPSSLGYTHTETRKRVRAGLHWQGENNATFYGLTWLSPEFSAQSEGQIVGSLRLDFKF